MATLLHPFKPASARKSRGQSTLQAGKLYHRDSVTGVRIAPASSRRCGNAPQAQSDGQSLKLVLRVIQPAPQSNSSDLLPSLSADMVVLKAVLQQSFNTVHPQQARPTDLSWSF